MRSSNAEFDSWHGSHITSSFPLRWDEELIDLAQTWTPKENSMFVSTVYSCL